jgi:hypothetical protein
MSTSTAVSGVSSEGKGVEVTEVKKEAVVAVTEIKKEAAAAAVEGEGEEEGEEGDCDCEECQGGATGGFAEYEEEGGWIDELGVDDHDFY